jgi:hypothetical protein
LSAQSPDLESGEIGGTDQVKNRADEFLSASLKINYSIKVFWRLTK